MEKPDRSVSEIKQDIIAHVDARAETIIRLSRKLYENPETAYQECQAANWLVGYLASEDFECQTGVGGVDTAFTARPRTQSVREPQIAFLAEYDALPKIGHGCGHNLIAAASLGAAVALCSAWPQAAASIRVIGTPAEEGGGGKVKLAEAGVFDGIRMALMFHPGQHNHLGANSLGRIKTRIEFFGQSTHAASAPERGINALDAIIGAYHNIGALRQQLPEDVRIHGIITHGGESPNVIPDYTAGLFYIRSIDFDYLNVLFEKFKDCCHGAAQATGCRCRITVEPPSLKPMKRNACLESIWHDNMALVGVSPGPEKTGIGSTDLGNISQIMPVIQPFLAICSPEISGHTAEFAQATQSAQGVKTLLDAAKLLALTAFDYLTSQEIQDIAAREFDGDGPSPLPPESR